MKYSIVLITALFLTSCTGSQGTLPSDTQSGATDSGTLSTQPGTTIDTPVGPPAAESNLMIVGAGVEQETTLNLVDNIGMLRINKGEKAKVTVKFAAEAGQTVKANLTTPGNDNANIRINQIIMPDGKSDGPFGRDMTYDLTQSGEYKIVIAESLMQGDSWSGEVDYTMSLE